MTDQVESHLKTFLEIIENTVKWRRYFYIFSNDDFFKKFVSKKIGKYLHEYDSDNTRISV